MVWTDLVIMGVVASVVVAILLVGIDRTGVWNRLGLYTPRGISVWRWESRIEFSLIDILDQQLDDCGLIVGKIDHVFFGFLHTVTCL